jgi:peptidoglycan/LPS O-acetylase OafA/YrhL
MPLRRNIRRPFRVTGQRQKNGMAERSVQHVEARAALPALGGRIAALDGLRGGAAFIVVVYHYLCLLHPGLAPNMTATPARIADTPLGLLWNGPFAVSVFFVLSGFVIAGAADRRRDILVANLVTRYLRLALPVLGSVILAWALLSLFPTAADTLRATLADPSPWFVHTYQGDAIPSFAGAVYDGLVGNFREGGSRLNNVLWTMRIEFLGSIGLFGLYWFVRGWLRFVLLGLAGIGIVLFFRDVYLAFVLGAGLYEVAKAGLLARLPLFLAPMALVGGVLLGAPGQGTWARWGLMELPGRLTPGNPRGLVPIGAATLFVYATLAMPAFARVLCQGLLQWLGRISFSLYLVHVPLLYTLVAYAHVTLPVGEAPIALAYFAGTLALAHLFTLAVDEPSLRLLRTVRDRLRPIDAMVAALRPGGRPLFCSPSPPDAATRPDIVSGPMARFPAWPAGDRASRRSGGHAVGAVARRRGGGCSQKKCTGPRKTTAGRFCR